MAQGSAVSRLPQIEQARMRCAASASAVAKGSISAERRFRRKSAARRAERGPRPGSLASSWTRRSMSLMNAEGGCPTPMLSPRSKRQLHAGRQLQPAGQFAHLLGDMAFDALLRIGKGRDDEILEDFGLLGIDERLVELDLAQIALAGERHLNEAAARRSGHLHLIEPRLHLGHLGLHLLRLLHHLAEILHGDCSPSLPSSAPSPASAAAAGSPAPSSRTASMRAPGKLSSTARTTGCCAASFLSEASRASTCSRSVGAPSSLEMLTTQRIPVHSPSSLP